MNISAELAQFFMDRGYEILKITCDGRDILHFRCIVRKREDIKKTRRRNNE